MGRGFNKEKEEGAGGWGLRAGSPGEDGGADKRERQPAPAPDCAPARDSAPPRPPRPPRDLPGNPLGSLTRTAGGRSPSGARGEPRAGGGSASPGGEARRRGGGVGEPRLFSAPSRLPALNGSVIDWPRVLFSPRVAGARGRLSSIFPAAAPRCGSCCPRPPRRPPRIYLWFQEEVGAESGIRLSSQVNTKNFLKGGGGDGERHLSTRGAIATAWG